MYTAVQNMSVLHSMRDIYFDTSVLLLQGRPIGCQLKTWLQQAHFQQSM
jgi:hypothetical protein